jgi:hypothetical protein
MVLLACAVAQGCAAQDGQMTALQAELNKLASTAQSLQQDLPSFTCTETGLSQAIKKNKVKQQVRFVAEVRVERTAAGRLDEQLQVTQVNGKPYSKGRFEPPFMVRGGFGESLFFFLPATQTCFRYSLGATGNQGRIDFESLPGSFDRHQCKSMGMPQGSVLLDDAGRPIPVERKVPKEYAVQVHAVDSAAIDFAPIDLDGKTYPLAAREVSTASKDDYDLRFEATFSGCHLFKATSAILPDVTPVPEGDSGAPHP